MIGIYTAEIVEEAEPPFSLGKQKKKTNILVTRCFLHYFGRNSLLEIL